MAKFKPLHPRVVAHHSTIEYQPENLDSLQGHRVGQVLKVLFDRKEGEYFVGRSEHDSPEVDNEVLVKAKKEYVRIGDFATVKITEATEYDLYGEIVI